MKNIHLQFLASLIGVLFLVSSCDDEEVVVADPSISVNPGSISFGDVDAGTPSNVESFTLTGENLTGDVAVSTQAPFAVATSADGTFGQTLNVTTNDFATGSVTVFTRFEPAETDEGEMTGEITALTEGFGGSVSVALSGTSVKGTTEPPAALLMEEHFDYAGGTLPSTDNTGTGEGNAAVGDGWVKVRAANNGISLHSPGLSFAGYPGSDVGNAVRLSFGAANESDVYVNNLDEPQGADFTGDFYVAYMLQIESFAAKGQFNRPVLLTDWNDNGGANWMTGPTIRNRAAADAADDDMVFGLKYGGKEFVDSNVVPEIGKTYLIVMKHSVTDTDFTNDNDEASLFVIEGEIPATEPATPALVYSNLPDGLKAKGVAILETNSQKGAYIVDGVKVAKSWEDLFK